MKKENVIEIIRDKSSVLVKNGVRQIGLFGSYAKGNEKKNSDVDILIDVDKDFSLSDLVKIKIMIEGYLKKNVDLAEYSSLHPLIKKKVLEEEVRII